MPQLYQQVSGGACSLTMYAESAPGKVPPGTKGVSLAFMSESFKKGSAKKQSTVIRNARGAGKPRVGLPQMSGQFESAAYAPQLGHLVRALCNVPVTTLEMERALDAEAVTELDMGIVGIPCAGHGFVQDAVISLVGTANYDGSYRVEEGTTADVIAISAPYVAEVVTAGCKVYRGRVPLLQGAAVNRGAGMVGLPVKGGVHALNPGEKVTIKGTTEFNGEYTLKEGTENGVLVIQTSFNDETFDGSPVAVPVFYRHKFTLPRRQPTLCMEKYLDYEDGAAVNKYRRFGFCKVNGLNFDFGGDDELKFTIDFAVGREFLAPAPVDPSPETLPPVTLDNIETSVWVAGVRRGDVESGNFANTFGIDAKAAVGDRGEYSRMPEGDPDCKATLSVFLETDELQSLSDNRSTVTFSLGICSITGDEAWFNYPEAELDSSGPAITGKEGLMQDITVMAFVNSGQSVFTIELVNRVPSYA